LTYPRGTSLHFVGGALSAIALGPYLASYVIFLSRRHARRIVSIIRQLSSNSKTLIIATHDPCLLSITKSVVVLQNGIAETMSVADAYSDDYVSDLLGLKIGIAHMMLKPIIQTIAERVVSEIHGEELSIDDYCVCASGRLM
jgi:energy-coupling factor transporter ATP-binding protein EcfA2